MVFLVFLEPRCVNGAETALWTAIFGLELSPRPAQSYRLLAVFHRIGARFVAAIQRQIAVVDLQRQQRQTRDSHAAAAATSLRIVRIPTASLWTVRVVLRVDEQVAHLFGFHAVQSAGLPQK